MWDVICKERIKNEVKEWYVSRGFTWYEALKTAMWFNHALYKKQKDYERVYYIRKVKKSGK